MIELLVGVLILFFFLATLLLLVPYALLLSAVGPGFIYLSHKIQSQPVLEAASSEELPAAIRVRAGEDVRALQEVGFEIVSCVCQPRCVLRESALLLLTSHLSLRTLSGRGPDVAAYSILMLNVSTLERATVVALRGANGTPPRLRFVAVEFLSRFDNGRSVRTSNSRLMSGSVDGPQAIQTQLPEAPVLRLLRTHRDICLKAASGYEAVFLEFEDGVQYLRREMAEDLREQQALGLLVLDRESGVLRPTWKGACLLCWSQLWPIASVRRARSKSAAARRLSGFEAASTYSPVERLS